MEKEWIKAKLDLDAPIDLDEVRHSYQEFGPIRMSQPGNPFEVVLLIEPCRCGDKNCSTEVVTVHRIVGLSQISWTLTARELLEYPSLTGFFDWVQTSGPFSSSGERLILESRISQKLGRNYHEIEHPFCACSECAKAIDKTELWERHLLTSLALHLGTFGSVVSSIKDEDEREAWRETFDHGYALGRLVGEYFLKARVEELAEQGMAAQAAVEKRTEASGARSTSNRHMRIHQMLCCMEKLAVDNPALLRAPIEVLAQLAIEDAAHLQPDLWTQGRGQMAEYLGEMKSDLRYQSRFRALLKSA